MNHNAPASGYEIEIPMPELVRKPVKLAPENANQARRNVSMMCERIAVGMRAAVMREGIPRGGSTRFGYEFVDRAMVAPELRGLRITVTIERPE